MLELLTETSQLTAASLLRSAIQNEPDDPVLTWRETVLATVKPEQPHLLKAVSFAQLQPITDHCFPGHLAHRPSLIHVRDALWLKGSGGLYDGSTGFALPCSLLTRFPRSRQTPWCKTHRVELTRPVTAFPRLERSLFIPFALCSNFGHFITETLSFLWPLFDSNVEELVGLPALLTGCTDGDPGALVIHALVRERHAFPVLESHLPEAMHLEEVWIPEPSLRLHAMCSETYLHTAAAVAEWLIQREQPDLSALPHSAKLYVSRSALGPETRSVQDESAFEALLEERGWVIFRPEQHALAEQVAVYRNAKVIAGFEGSALHGLSFLGKPEHPPTVVLLGDTPSPDYFLQFRAQRLPGFFIQCTRIDPASNKPEWVSPRLLNGSTEVLASMVDALSRAV